MHAHTAAELLASARATVEAMRSIAHPEMVAILEGETVRKRFIRWHEDGSCHIYGWTVDRAPSRSAATLSLLRAGYRKAGRGLESVWIRNPHA